MNRQQVRTSRHFDTLEQEAFLGLWRTYDRLRALEDELFGRFGLTPQQYNVLRLLNGEHPETVNTLDLASRLVSRAPDITRMLDKLEQNGLIDRERSAEDRRVVRTGITDAGRALLRKMREPIQACHEQQLGHLSRKDLQSLVSLLRAARLPHEETDSTWL